MYKLLTKEAAWYLKEGNKNREARQQKRRVQHMMDVQDMAAKMSDPDWH
jgi:hypothetical protein